MFKYESYNNFNDFSGWTTTVIGTLTLSSGVTTSTEAFCSEGTTKYYSQGTTITLGHEDAPDGYIFTGYTVKDANNGDVTVTVNEGVYTFEMPASDVTVSAIFTKLYTITFVDEDGTTVLQSGPVEEGQTPAYTGETPTKAATDEYVYTFAGWSTTPGGSVLDPLPVADADVTYYAVYAETSLAAATWIGDYLGDWDNPDNWDIGYLPTSATVVTFMEIEDEEHNLIKSSNAEVGIDQAKCKEIVIADNGYVAITPASGVSGPILHFSGNGGKAVSGKGTFAVNYISLFNDNDSGVLTIGPANDKEDLNFEILNDITFRGNASGSTAASFVITGKTTVSADAWVKSIDKAATQFKGGIDVAKGVTAYMKTAPNGSTQIMNGDVTLVANDNEGNPTAIWLMQSGASLSDGAKVVVDADHAADYYVNTREDRLEGATYTVYEALPKPTVVSVSATGATVTGVTSGQRVVPGENLTIGVTGLAVGYEAVLVITRHSDGSEIVNTKELPCVYSMPDYDIDVTMTAVLKTNGYCGTDDPNTTDVDESETVTWNYDTDTKTITISGSGPMADYASDNELPWIVFLSELANVAIGSDVTSIGSNAFNGCTSLTSLDIPTNVTSIGNNAFAGCTNLATVTVNRYDAENATRPLTTVGTGVFPATTTIIVPAAALQSYLQAESWNAYADKVISTGYCGKDDTETEDVDESHNVIWTLAKNTGDQIQGNVPLTLTISKNPEVTVEGADFSMADDYPFNDGVSGISEYEYTTSMSITQAVISEGVTSIGARAFMNCENMATVSIPSSVTSIGVGAFLACKSLASNITIPDGVTTINNSTFSGCVKLTTVVLPNGLATIGERAFAGCDKLESIGVANSTTNEMPSDLTAIGVSAFSGSGLPAITLNEGLETIDVGAFSNTKLTTINIPANVTAIGEGAFTCNYLEGISVADGNTYFATDDGNVVLLTSDGTTLLTYACANTETTSYAVPNGVTRIGAGAFKESHNLTEVTLPEGLKTIGEGAFYDCDAITDIAIPASVESIGANGFYDCSKLATIRVFRGAANGITTIGEDAFTVGGGSPVVSTRRIYVPETSLDTYRAADNWTKYAPGHANWIVAAPWGDALRGGFCGVDDATTTTVDESKNVAWALTANGENPEGCTAGSGLTLTITVAAEGQTSYDMADEWPFNDGVDGISEYEATTALSITQAVIGEGVTSIGESAFMNCENLATVSIPTTVTSIGVGAFVACKSLASEITIPDGVTVINNSTFNGCTKLTTVVLPSGLATIGEGAFAGCYKLESIGVAGSTTNEMPTSLTAIGASAFSGSGLPAITLNEELETIGGDAFRQTDLTTINIPASVENIGEGAFTCFKLASISVSDGNTHFTTDGDKALIALIDDNNKTLLTYARVNTATSYTVPDGVTRIGADAFRQSNNLTEVTLPEGLKTIGDGAFSHCDELTDTNLPEGLTTISANAFDQCHKIETFVVPSTVTYIGDYGLLYNDYCIMLPTTPPEIGWNGTKTCAMGASSQDGTGDGVKIYVPASSLDAYRKAAVWNLFSDNRLVAGDDPVLFSSTATNTWMTWCSDKAYGKPVGCKAYTVSAVSDGEVTLTPVAGLLLPAYTPLLIKRDDTSAALTAIGGAAVTEPTSEDVYNATTGLVTKASSGFSMLGAATDAPVSGSITEGYSYALFDGEFLKIDDSTLDIPAHRCMLTLPVPHEAPRLHININGEATSLSEAKEDSSLFTLHSSLSGWYTLDGRKLDKQPTTKGLYIYKGKKVVIK
jgi:hypothetical protein